MKTPAPVGPQTLVVALLLYFSGLCSLVFQTAWMRELRLVFGASTPATATVLAIFMGGLGLGAWRWGRRADAAAHPLRLYGRLELVVSATAALTPLLMTIARTAYAATGGTASLGHGAATVVRLGLAVLVIGVPAVAMGGTLPAAVRAITTRDDERRTGLSVLYGANALGAVTGTVLGTFFLFERLGTRGSLWLAAGLNGLVGLTALWLDRSKGPRVSKTGATKAGPAEPPLAPRGFVLAGAAVTGFSFFLLELVWYRMLGPLLGGSVFTFGLILAMALLGIGLGSLASQLPGRARRPTLEGFALTCAFCAIAVAFPLALGDRVAVMALMLGPWSSLGFELHVAAWACVAALVVLPAAFMSGLQFPLLVGLLGRDEEQVGVDVGRAYAFNTAGAIAGSLLGGFGAIPVLGAVGAWRLCALLLTFLSIGTLVLGRRTLTRTGGPAIVLLLVLSIGLSAASGPTAFWRHSPIGAGRGRDSSAGLSANSLVQFEREQRLGVFWERDGRESSLAMHDASAAGIAFSVNGKIDGNSLSDAPTQVMGGLIGALMHDAPRRVLVIGLGTGSTSGWLADLPGVERVDVVEIEPEVVEVARACAAVNRDVLNNPKVHLLFTDAREVLTANGDRYDLIFSEPSNPYRAGVASLFTREFYRSVAERLAPGGVFLQWLQTYEVDPASVAGIYATLNAELPFITTWTTMESDLVLAATVAEPRLEGAVIQRRIVQEPLATALLRVWRTDTIEGVNSHLVGDQRLAAALAAKGAGFINTDDRPLIEFAFARSAGAARKAMVPELFDLSLKVNGRSGILGADTNATAANAVRTKASERASAAGEQQGPDELLERLVVLKLFFKGRFEEAAAQRLQTAYAPLDAWEQMVDSTLAVASGSPEGPARIEALAGRWPIEALVLRAIEAAARTQFDEATAWAVRSFEALRVNPWVEQAFVERLFSLARQLGTTSAARAEQLLSATNEPLAVNAYQGNRRALRAMLSLNTEFIRWCPRVLSELEPNAPWTAEMLLYRARCYPPGSPQRARAEEDLSRFREAAAPSLVEWMGPP